MRIMTFLKVTLVFIVLAWIAIIILTGCSEPMEDHPAAIDTLTHRIIDSDSIVIMGDTLPLLPLNTPDVQSIWKPDSARAAGMMKLLKEGDGHTGEIRPLSDTEFEERKRRGTQ
jgi:hypothetical protein